MPKGRLVKPRRPLVAVLPVSAGMGHNEVVLIYLIKQGGLQVYTSATGAERLCLPRFDGL